jgi:membrane-bound lytic murein transglycosylase D
MTALARAGCLALLLALSAPAFSQQAAPATPATQNGRDVYARFRGGLADPACDGDNDSSARWRGHFAGTPARLVSADDDVLPLFAYVVDALRTAGLPTEYALIPFVESGYKPGARSAGGPAGLWQMIAVTARDHAIPIRAGYDGRLSPVDSTRAAVRYLKTLHGMFAGDWRLAVMAYNAGEYRVFSALRQSRQVASSADPEKLTSLSGITRAYVRKLHALSCLLDHADDRDEWLKALDRPVPLLQAYQIPTGTPNLQAWAATNGRDAGMLRRLNPAFADGRIASSLGHPEILAPVLPPASPFSTAPVAPPSTAIADVGSRPAASDHDDNVKPAVRTHRVSRGESLQRIARRYKLRMADLMALNGLVPRSALRPGMVLKLGPDGGE